MRKIVVAEGAGPNLKAILVSRGFYEIEYIEPYPITIQSEKDHYHLIARSHQTGREQRRQRRAHDRYIQKYKYR